MYQFVLFDLDQTLLLRSPSLVERIYALFAPLQPGLNRETVDRAYAESEFWQGEQIRKENETGVRLSDAEYLEGLLAVYRRFLPVEKVRNQFVALFIDQVSGQYQLLPGRKELLEALQRCGIAMGIVSNNRSSVREDLHRLGIENYFACVILSEEVGLYKPDPQILTAACHQMKLAPNQGIYVGDHPFDVVCAHGAGMAALWIPPNPFFRLPEGTKPPECSASTWTQVWNMLVPDAPL